MNISQDYELINPHWGGISMASCLILNTFCSNYGLCVPLVRIDLFLSLWMFDEACVSFLLFVITD